MKVEEREIRVREKSVGRFYRYKVGVVGGRWKVARNVSD